MISVVVPAFNEEKNIAKCLESFLIQNTSKKFEIIIVDNASTDKTAQVVRTFEKKLPLRLVKENLKGRSPARKKGFSVAKGEIILSTDADTFVPPDWIEKMSEYFDSPLVSAISGTCRIDDCTPRVNFLVNHLQPLAMKIYRVIFGHYWLSGFNFGIRKDVYKASGGFNPKLNIQEDIDLSFKVSKRTKIKFINYPVLVSGRRFRLGLIKGSYPYFKSFYEYYFLKDEKKVYLSDER